MSTDTNLSIHWTGLTFDPKILTKICNFAILECCCISSLVGKTQILCLLVLSIHVRQVKISYSSYFQYCSTCIQVPRFSFREKKISGLEWGSNPHTHISGVMLYQLSYQALGSKLVGRKGIQVLVLGAHYIRN